MDGVLLPKEGGGRGGAIYLLNPIAGHLVLPMLLQILLLIYLLSGKVTGECSDVSFSSEEAEFDGTKRIERIAVNGLVSAFHVYVAVSDDSYSLVRQSTGHPLVLFSSLSQPGWSHVDLVGRKVKIKRVFGEADRPPLLLLSICQYENRIFSFDDSPFSIDSARVGLISMYENELRVMFRSFRSCLLFYSESDKGDLLIAQVVHGTAHVIFDFGSLTPSHISAGRALNDGLWHELRWVHQFNSVQLYIDGILYNQTTPLGLYRKLDLGASIYVGGRPESSLQGIEQTLRGCLARLQLNSVDLLLYAPKDIPARCHLPSPPSLTLFEGEAHVPFTFLPFSFEFRLIRKEMNFLRLLDAEQSELLGIEVDGRGMLVLSSNCTEYKQQSNPAIEVTDGSWHSFVLTIRGSRLEIDVDGLIVLWLEGAEVRSVSAKMATIVISASGCHRSATLDLPNVMSKGSVHKGVCSIVDRCTPNPCENGGECVQVMLDSHRCLCKKGYSGKYCQDSIYPASCEEFFFVREKKIKKEPSKPQMVTLDLDGGDSLNPFVAHCQIELDALGDKQISTIIQHDLSSPLEVRGETKPGEVKRDIDYGLGMEELDRLVEGFESCQQWMSFECRGGTHLMTYGEERTASTWYATRGHRQAQQWADAPPYSRMCGCASYSNCTQNRQCNCDSGLDGVDQGINPYSQFLPIMKLFVGGTSSSSSATVSIGSLVCAHKVSFQSVTFSDRNARLSSSLSFRRSIFRIALHVRFAHPNMNIFTWESLDSMNWYNLATKDGHVVGEIVAGGVSFSVRSGKKVNDGEWHSIEWEADEGGMRIRVDGKEDELTRQLILPPTITWTIGSRTGRDSVGFAGVIRYMFLNGHELALSTIVRHNSPQGIIDGERGKCVNHDCKYGGRCVDFYDSFTCDCSLSPFGGEDCSREYGIWVPSGSSLSIPWQNPAQTALCHRIAVKTESSSVFLLRAKALFAESSFNMSIDGDGHLSVSIHDGFFFSVSRVIPNLLLNDNLVHDVSLCASSSVLSLSVDGFQSWNVTGNWTFFIAFNAWNIVDKNYTGCLSRLQIGASFPLKAPKEARLSYSGGVLFGACPRSHVTQRVIHSKDVVEGIHLGVITHNTTSVVTVASLAGLCAALSLTLGLAILVCYMRSRPDGVYQTHEGTEKCGQSRSEEPLVDRPSVEKEYFC